MRLSSDESLRTSGAEGRIQDVFLTVNIFVNFSGIIAWIMMLKQKEKRWHHLIASFVQT